MLILNEDSGIFPTSSKHTGSGQDNPGFLEKYFLPLFMVLVTQAQPAQDVEGGSRCEALVDDDCSTLLTLQQGSGRSHSGLEFDADLYQYLFAPRL